jgi:arabinan endo-1,5-alpha-L-arabinosidase
MPAADWRSGMLAHYDFDDAGLSNTIKTSEHATLKHNGSTSQPTVLEDELDIRTGNVVKVNFGANGAESYVEINNPLYGQDLADGATISFWVRRLDDTNLWDALYGFYNPATGARLYMTGNCYTGYNSNTGNWIDINHPTAVTPAYLAGTRWHLVTVVFARSKYSGHTLYVDGVAKSSGEKISGEQDGTAITQKYNFDSNQFVDHIASCEKLYLGYGSFWGSAPACYDDVMVYNRALTSTEVGALNLMENRVFNFHDYITGIRGNERTAEINDETVYDLQGRKAGSSRQLPKGIYIRGGRKFIVR